MAWAKVDDKLHASVKWRRASKGARALWTTALSWCSDQENGGHVPADMLRVLDGTPSDAKSLVNAGLWNVVDDGWEFHNWTEYNPDSASLKAKREAESLGGKRGNHARWHVKQGITVPDCEFCTPSGHPSGTRSGPDQGGESGANPPDPTRPVPTRPDNKNKQRGTSGADAATTQTIEHQVTDAAYHRLGKGFNFIATRAIAKWAIHDKQATPQDVHDSIVAVYEMGKPITKQTIGQHLDGHLTRGGNNRPLDRQAEVLRREMQAAQEADLLEIEQ